MDNTYRNISADKTAWLRPLHNDSSHEQKRIRLLLAINDANEMGFDSTKAALISLLQELER